MVGRTTIAGVVIYEERAGVDQFCWSSDIVSGIFFSGAYVSRMFSKIFCFRVIRIAECRLTNVKISSRKDLVMSYSWLPLTCRASSGNSGCRGRALAGVTELAAAHKLINRHINRPAD